jgi:hypothetical protein
MQNIFNKLITYLLKKVIMTQLIHREMIFIIIVEHTNQKDLKYVIQLNVFIAVFMHKDEKSCTSLV